MRLNLAPLFSDHAVLQRERPVAIWGKAAPGAWVDVGIAGSSGAAMADPEGSWRVCLPAAPAGGPWTLKVSAGGERCERRDIWFGEVWHGAGQSNMEWTLAQTEEARTDYVRSGDPRVRMFTAGRARALARGGEAEGSWAVADGSGAEAAMSAAAYHFARRLAVSLDMAVGVVVTAWGGTTIDRWLPREDLAALPGWEDSLAAIPREIGPMPELSFHRDEGRARETAGWERVDCDEGGWEPLVVPSMWQAQGWDFNGAAWYRRAVQIPSEWEGRELAVDLGKVDDFDDTFFNGERIGGLDKSEPNAFDMLRRYRAPARLVRAGRAVIAVRVFDHFGDGGLPGPAAAMRIFPVGAPDQALPLAGGWLAKPERKLPRSAASGGPEPTTLYHGMMEPVLGYAARGALWYQGESDAPRAGRYAAALRAWIRRQRIERADDLFAVGIVELPRFQPVSPTAGQGRWAELRAAQAEAADATGAGLVPMIDAGDPQDIHPRNKPLVGERLSRWALSEVYGARLPWRAARPLAVDRGATEWRVRYAPGTAPRPRDGGAVAGFDAVARIDGDDILVAREGATMDRVAYCQDDAPHGNLVDRHGLPLAAFIGG